jgi:nitrite reductase/ring-hydroxylating ferredoxin subunit
MSREGRVAAFVDALLRDRRPKRFPAEPDEAEAIQAAAALRAARPGADLPSPEFVAQLERRLARESGGGAGGTGTLSRRRLLAAAGASAAAAVAAGIAVDRLAAQPASPARTVDTAGGGPGQDALDVKDPQWVPVIAASAVADGQAVRFSAAAVEGFVVNSGGQFDALSAVCTHMGCILKFNADTRHLDCPCHGAAFDLEGAPVRSEYLKSLARVQSRVRDGMVEVQVNRA